MYIHTYIHVNIHILLITSSKVRGAMIVPHTWVSGLCCCGCGEFFRNYFLHRISWIADQKSAVYLLPDLVMCRHGRQIVRREWGHRFSWAASLHSKVYRLRSQTSEPTVATMGSCLTCQCYQYDGESVKCLDVISCICQSVDPAESQAKHNDPNSAFPYALAYVTRT